MDKHFYFHKLYPLQDRIFQFKNRLDTGFYLTSGTAASRGYLKDLHNLGEAMAIP